MLRLYDEGYCMVNSVHDEILLLCEEKEAKFVEAKVLEIMTKPPEWALDLPLAAESWIAKRYRK